MKNPYPKEKFSKAVNSLATSPKSIQKRVSDAYCFHLLHVKPEWVPEEIRKEFEQLRVRLTSVEPTGDEGSVAATTNVMSTDEAIEISKSIVEMAFFVRRDYQN